MTHRTQRKPSVCFLEAVLLGQLAKDWFSRHRRRLGWFGADDETVSLGKLHRWTVIYHDISYVYLMYILCISYVYLMYILCISYVYLTYILRISYVYLTYILRISYVYLMYILCISYVYLMYILCISYVYLMYILCISYVYLMYILCISYVYLMYILCISYVYLLYILCISYVYLMYILCISYVYLMYILCISYVLDYLNFLNIEYLHIAGSRWWIYGAEEFTRKKNGELGHREKPNFSTNDGILFPKLDDLVFEKITSCVSFGTQLGQFHSLLARFIVN